eukprot:11941664-Alexandrium_andersonii.AAC.1
MPRPAPLATRPPRRRARPREPTLDWVGRSGLLRLTARRPPINTGRAGRPESRGYRGWRSQGRW